MLKVGNVPNQAMQQTRDKARRHGRSFGCELLIAGVRQQAAQSQSRADVTQIALARTLRCSPNLSPSRLGRLPARQSKSELNGQGPAVPAQRNVLGDCVFVQVEALQVDYGAKRVGDVAVGTDPGLPRQRLATK